MTRDEQIAQLKPGSLVRLNGLEVHFVIQAGDFFLYREMHSNIVRIAHTVSLILPEPPPKPKAVPGQKYQRILVGGYRTESVGLRDGRLYVAGFQDAYDFDPTIWTPIDDVKVGE